VGPSAVACPGGSDRLFEYLWHYHQPVYTTAFPDSRKPGSQRHADWRPGMAGPVGVMLGSFVIPRFMRQIEGRKLLLAGVVIEIVLIVALMSTDSIFAWFVIRFLGGLTGVSFLW